MEQTISTLSAVAHHLELEFFPAEHRLLDQHLVRSATPRGRGADGVELLAVVGDAAAGAAEREEGRRITGKPYRRQDL